MTLKVGINGFGRIGRNLYRLLVESNDNSIEIVAINDLTDAATLAHLLKYDSVHGKLDAEISHTASSIVVNGKEIKVVAEKDPKNLKWKDWGVSLVHECTGQFTSKEKASVHLQSGAKKVIVSAPCTDADLTIAYGINHTDYNPSKHHILSCASCTTNCLAPVAKVILENFGIVRGTMTTCHSYTNDQRILDLPHKDLRRARAAAVSMIPTTTGAAKAVGMVLPALKGKCDGISIRVPTTDVSVVDFVVEVERDTSVEEVNRALKNASENSLKGILGVCEEPLVSVDFVGNTLSSIVDAQITMVIGKRMVKVLSWYDNEMGFSQRMIDSSKFIANSL